MNAKERFSLLSAMQEHACVSGREQDLADFFVNETSFPFQKDGFGNLYLTLKGNGKNKRHILLEAHMDEIGLTVAEITEDGFLSCQTIGGIQKDILPGTSVTVFGRIPFPAVIGSKPPHLARIKSKDGESTPVYVTCGFKDRKEAEKWVGIGDVIHFDSPVCRMENKRVLSRGLDNKVSVLALLEAYSELKEPYHDITFLFSVEEETTGKGAKTFTNDSAFDLAVVVDAGFAKAEGLDPTHTLKMDAGPSVSITERENVTFEKRIIAIAEKNKLPCQILAEPGGTGTNSKYVQIRHGGIPTAVLSIPILNMHTSSEIVCVSDIESAAMILEAVANESDISEGKKVSYVRV